MRLPGCLLIIGLMAVLLVAQHIGKLVILVGDYSDRTEGYLPITWETKRIAFECGLKQCCTDIVRFSHGASSSKKVYRSAFIPGLHDICSIFQKPAE